MKQNKLKQPKQFQVVHFLMSIKIVIVQLRLKIYQQKLKNIKNSYMKKIN